MDRSVFKAAVHGSITRGKDKIAYHKQISLHSTQIDQMKQYLILLR